MRSSSVLFLVTVPLLSTIACDPPAEFEWDGGDIRDAQVAQDGATPRDAAVPRDATIRDAAVAQDATIRDAAVAQDATIRDAAVAQDATIRDAAIPRDSGMSVDAGTGIPYDGGPAPRCTGMTGAPGTNTRSYMTSDDIFARKVIVHVPDNLDPNAPVPILFAMHGASMNGDKMHGLTGFDAIADRERFVVVYPSGTPGLAPWNVGTRVCGAGNLVSGNGDDIAFVERVLDDIANDQCIDRRAVFVTGFSMGGYFSNNIGCQAGNQLVRAIAPHSGGTYRQIDCPGGPLPALIIHGSGDTLISPMCGDGAAERWVERNGCSATYQVTPVEGGECRRYDGCPADGEVVHCVFDGMIHGWAGAPTTGDLGFYGGGEQFENASELIWRFFARQLP